MTVSDGTYVEIKGTFSFAINQSGLDYENERERKDAVNDFWDCWEEFLDSITHLNHIPNFQFDPKDLIVEEGE